MRANNTSGLACKYTTRSGAGAEVSMRLAISRNNSNSSSGSVRRANSAVFSVMKSVMSGALAPCPRCPGRAQKRRHDFLRLLRALQRELQLRGQRVTRVVAIKPLEKLIFLRALEEGAHRPAFCEQRASVVLPTPNGSFYRDIPMRRAQLRCGDSEGCDAHGLFTFQASRSEIQASRREVQREANSGH